MRLSGELISKSQHLPTQNVVYGSSKLIDVTKMKDVDGINWQKKKEALQSDECWHHSFVKCVFYIFSLLLILRNSVRIMYNLYKKQVSSSLSNILFADTKRGVSQRE